MTADSVLRRKVAVRSDDRGGGETGARAWRTAFARVARDMVGLDLAVPVLRDDRRSLAELLDLVPERALLAVLEGPGNGLGLLVMSPELTASVIESQTIGRVIAGPVLPRRPTRTDAAMSAGLIDGALAALEAALATAPDLTWTAGFRYASFLEDARPLDLLLDDIPYRVLICDLDIAAGARQGRLLLALPAEGRGPKPAPAPAPGETPATAQAWQAALSGAVLGADVTVEAVITRIRLPLSQAMALEPGMILPLPDARLDRIALQGPGGQPLGTGRLGQNRGSRALKMDDIGGDAASPHARPTEIAPRSAPLDSAPAETPAADPPPPALARSA